MRLFTGLDLPADIAATLAGWQAALKNEDTESDVRWSPAANFHITTKFIGEWPENRLEELIGVLAGNVPRPRSSVRIEIPGLGSMSNAHQGHILYARVECPSGQLQTLAAATSMALQRDLQIPDETRSYRPHITLGRARRDFPAVGAIRTEHLSFEAPEFALYRSDPAPQGKPGTVYSKLSRFPFATNL
ncbi:hypothetical protein F183_A27800 [Bryobacterales bacterium F-183]|nr:hypothetical protein F183_A27800 [Bryobacterales bacterium F-183]